MTKNYGFIDKPSYSTREVFEAFRKRAIYEKLAGKEPVDNMIWMLPQNISRFVDKPYWDSSPFAKYWIVRGMEPAMQRLEDEAYITRKGAWVAIHELTVIHLLSLPKSEVDAYLDKNLRENT